MGIVDYGNMVRNTFSSARVGPSTNRSISSSVRISVLQRSRIFKFCEKLHAPFRLEFLPRVRSFFSLPFPPSLPFFLSFFPFPPRRGIYRLGINPWKTDVATVVPLLSMPLVFRPVSGDPFFMPETHESRTRATRNASRDDRAINLRICK